MKKRLIDLGYKIGMDLLFGIFAAIIAHYAIVGIVPGVVTRVTGLVGNTGTSLEVNINELFTGYDRHFDAEGYAQALAKQKQAEIERRQETTDNIKDSFSNLFSIFNCFILLFGIRFVFAYITGNYNYYDERYNTKDPTLKIEFGTKKSLNSDKN